MNDGTSYFAWTVSYTRNMFMILNTVRCSTRLGPHSPFFLPVYALSMDKL
jgi:hypothetical protein